MKTKYPVDGWPAAGMASLAPERPPKKPRPHPVEGKARTRKPETVLRDLKRTVRFLYAVTAKRGETRGWPYFLNAEAQISELRRSLNELHPGDGKNTASPAVAGAELRRSLRTRDTKGTK